MSHRRAVPALLAAAVAAAVPVAAHAGAPHATTDLIIPNVSLAGVKLGSTYAVAHRAWGTGGSCSANASCNYAVTKSLPSRGTASFLAGLTTAKAKHATVIEITIQTGSTKTGTPTFTGPLTRYRTAKGIGLGSTRAQLKAAYKGLKASGRTIYVLKGTGAHQTVFSLAGGRVSTISMQSMHIG